MTALPPIPKLPKIPGLPRIPGMVRPPGVARPKPKITVEQLNALGADALKGYEAELTKPEDTRDWFTKLTDVLDVPRNLIVRNVIAPLAGMKEPETEAEIAQAQSLGIRRGFDGGWRVPASAVLAHLGVEPGPVRSILGFVGDIGLDPLTYYGLAVKAGISIGKHLPQIAGRGRQAIEATAKAGRWVEPELMQAIRPLGKRAMRTARRGGEAGIAQALSRAATEGAVPALQYAAKYGRQGRGILRFPGMKEAVGTVRWGGKAKAYRNVVEQLAHPELQKPITEAVGAARKATAGAKTKAAQLAEAIGRVKARGTAVGDAEVAAAQRMGMEVPPAAVVPKIRRAALKAAGPIRPLKAVVTEAKAGSLAAEKEATLAAQAAERAQGSMNAPPVLKAFREAYLGKPVTPGAPGPINVLRQAKRYLFGPDASSPFAQQVHAIGQRATRGAGGMGAMGASDFAKAMKPEVARLLADPKVQAAFPGGEKELRTVLYRLAETGLTPEEAARFSMGAGGPGSTLQDVIHETFAKAGQAGLLADKGVQDLIGKYRATMSEMRAQQLAAGLKVGKETNYVHGVTTPEARPYIQAQDVMAPKVGGPRAGSGFTRADLSKTRLLTFERPGAAPVQYLSTAKEKIAALKAAGFKPTASNAISRAQFNQWSRDGQLWRLTGKARPDVAQFRGDLFAEDLAASYGSAVAGHQRQMANVELQKLIEPYGSVIKPGDQVLFPNYRQAKIPQSGGPFDPLIKAGVYAKVYPVQIAEMLDNLTRTWNTPRAMEKLIGFTDSYLKVWKWGALFHPSFAIRNGFQNAVGMMMADGNPFGQLAKTANPRTKMLVQAVRESKPELVRGMLFKTRGGDVTGEAFYNLLRDHNRIGVGQAGGQMDLPGRFLEGFRGTSMFPAMETGKKLGSKVIGGIFTANRAIEDRMAIGAVWQFMDQGMAPKDAIMQSFLAMPDMTNMTVLENEVMRRLMPFYSWVRRNGALQLFHYLPQKPAYMALLPKFKTFAEGFRGKDNVPEELRPMWMREQMGAQVSGDQTGGLSFQPMNWTPFQEAAGALNLPMVPGESVRMAVQNMNPLLRAMYEAGTGVNVFRGEKYPKGTNYTSAELARALPSALGGRSNTPLDTLATLRPVREWGPGGRQGAMPNAAAGIARFLIGGSVQPVSKVGGTAAMSAQLRDEVTRTRSEIARAIQANDNPLALSKTVQLLRIYRRMAALGLPVPKAIQAMPAMQGATSAKVG